MTPSGEIAAGEVERVTQLDEHAERHHQPEDVLAPGVVNEGFDDDESPAVRQRIIGGFDELLLSVEVPVVKDVAHRDDIGSRKRLGEEIAGGHANAVAKPRTRIVSSAIGATIGMS